MRQFKILLISGMALLSFAILGMGEENSNKKLSVAIIKEQPNAFETLPDEVLVKIIRQLIYGATTLKDINDIKTLRLVNKRFLNIIDDPYVQKDLKLAQEFVAWHQMDKQSYTNPPAGFTAIMHDGLEWYENYLELFPEKANDEFGYGSLLSLALINEKPQIVTLLLNHGAKAPFTDLLDAIKQGEVEQVKELLDIGAPLYGSQTVIFLGKPTTFQESALLIALKQFNQNPQIIKLLLDHGATLTPYEKTTHPYPIYFAQTSTVAALLMKHHISEIGDRALIAAMNSGPPLQLPNIDLIEFLLDKGANVNATDKYGNTPLHYALFIYDPQIGMYSRPGVLTTQAQIIWLLLNSHANVEAPDIDGQTPFSIALETGDVRLIKLLKTYAGLPPTKRKKL